MMSEAKQSAKSEPDESDGSRRMSQGPVMPIGGAEDKNGTKLQTILRRFVDLAGGRASRILVIPTA